MTDEAYIRALWAEHGGALYRRALSLADGDRQTAEDLVQETMVRAWLRPGGRERAPTRPWLLAVIRNIAIDAYRARGARPPEVGDDMLDNIPADDNTDRDLMAWTVTEALKSLKPPHLAVIVEIYYRERSVAEAADALGIPLGTVKSRLYAALKALAEALQQRGVTASVTV